MQPVDLTVYYNCRYNTTSARLIVCLKNRTFAFSSARFFVRFVANRCILQQECLKGQIGTCLLGKSWYNF